jgi:hypothetical protein
MADDVEFLAVIFEDISFIIMIEAQQPSRASELWGALSGEDDEEIWQSGCYFGRGSGSSRDRKNALLDADPVVGSLRQCL